MSFKKICICLILIFCIIGAASAAEDVSTDVVDASDDAVAVDAVSEDVSDSLESVVEDEPVVDESAPAQDENVGAVSGQSHESIAASNDEDQEIIGESVIYLSQEDFTQSKSALNNAINNANENTTIIIRSGTTIPRASASNGHANITIIGENRETVLVTSHTIRSGVAVNYNNTLTWVNVTFSCSIELSNTNYKFINCTFLNSPLQFDGARSSLTDPDVYNYAFENCEFVNYTQNNVVVSNIFAFVSISDCIFNNVTADSIAITTANRTDDSGRQAGVTIKDSTFKDVTINGVAKVQTELLSNVKVEDCEYIGFEATTNPVEDGDYTYLNATKLKVVAVDSVVDISSPEKGVVVITLTDNSTNPIAGATVKYTVNGGEEQTVTTGEDGKATITGLTGEVTIAVNYEGNESFKPISDSKFFNFTEEPVVPAKVATKITAPKVSAVYNVAKNLVITLTDKDGKALANKKVTVKVGTISKTLNTNAKGQVSLNVATLVPKTYTATVKFAGDDGYLASSVSPKVVVSKAKPKITAKAKTFKVKVKTKKYTVTLKNNKGKVLKKVKLTLKVGKKTYKATTNSKGKATFKITKLSKKGKYTATVKFAGSKYYKALSKKVKITVKK